MKFSSLSRTLLFTSTVSAVFTSQDPALTGSGWYDETSGDVAFTVDMPFEHNADFKLSLDASSDAYVELKSANAIYLPSKRDIGGTTEVTTDLQYSSNILETEIVDGVKENEIEFNIEGDYSVGASEVAATFIVELYTLDKRIQSTETYSLTITATPSSGSSTNSTTSDSIAPTSSSIGSSTTTPSASSSTVLTQPSGTGWYDDSSFGFTAKLPFDYSDPESLNVTITGNEYMLFDIADEIYATQQFIKSWNGESTNIVNIDATSEDLDVAFPGDEIWFDALGDYSSGATEILATFSMDFAYVSGDITTTESRSLVITATSLGTSTNSSITTTLSTIGTSTITTCESNVACTATSSGTYENLTSSTNLTFEGSGVILSGTSVFALGAGVLAMLL